MPGGTPKEIHKLKAAKAFFVSKVPNPAKLTTITVPKKAMNLVQQCYNDYIKNIKKYQHASVVNKILRRRGHQFTPQSDPNETARLEKLKEIFKKAKKYLNDAADYFEGCAGADVIKKYSDKVDKDFEELIAKDYITDADIQQGATEFPKENFRIVKPSGMMQIVPPIQIDSRSYQNTYSQRVTFLYTFAYDTFRALLKTKFQHNDAQGHQVTENLLDYLARPRGAVTSDLDQRLRDGVNTLKDAAKEFKTQKKRVNGLKNSKEYLKLLNDEYKVHFQNILSECEKIEQQLKIRVEGAVHRHFMATHRATERSEAKNAIVGLSAGIQSIANNMLAYQKNAISGNPLESTFSSIYTALDGLQKTLNTVTQAQRQDGRTLANQIALTTTRAEDFMKTFDKYLNDLQNINAQTTTCANKINELVDKMESYNKQKAAVKRQWIMFITSTILGLAQNSLPTLANALTVTPQSVGVDPLQ